jgi:hypothetical protein
MVVSAHGQAAPSSNAFVQDMTATVVAVTAILVRQANKLATATAVVATASLVRAVGKIVAATAVAATATLVRQTGKILAATGVAVTATLAALRVFLRTLTATTVLVTASLVKQAGKPLTATAVALSGSLRKQVGKPVTATVVVVTGSLTALRVFLRALTATTVAVSGSVVKQVGKLMAASVGGATYRASVLADSPLVYYRLGEPSGTVATDLGSAGQNATYVGSPTLGVAASMGDGDTAVTLNGSTQYANATNNAAFDLTGPMTIEARINPAAVGANSRFLAKDGAYGFGLHTTAKLKFTTFGVKDYISVTAPTLTANGTWRHVAAVFDSAQDVTFFMDGVQYDTIAGTVNPSTSASPLIVGARSVSLEFFNGTADEVVLYPAALSAAQILAHFNATPNSGVTWPTVALAASVVKQTAKRLTATTVAVTATLAALRVFLRVLTATTVAVTASMVRQTAKPLAVTVAATASVVKRITHALTATVAATGSLVPNFISGAVGSIYTFFFARPRPGPGGYTGQPDAVTFEGSPDDGELVGTADRGGFGPPGPGTT